MLSGPVVTPVLITVFSEKLQDQVPYISKKFKKSAKDKDVAVKLMDLLAYFDCSAKTFIKCKST